MPHHDDKITAEGMVINQEMVVENTGKNNEATYSYMQKQMNRMMKDVYELGYSMAKEEGILNRCIGKRHEEPMMCNNMECDNRTFKR